MRSTWSLEGELAVTKRAGEVEAAVATVGPGAVQGEIAVLEGGARRATVRAITPSRLLRVARDDLFDVLAGEPGLLRSLVATVAGRLRGIEALLADQARLASLGTLAAGLAHELNNPAAAARSSASRLADALDEWDRASAALGTLAAPGDGPAALRATGAGGATPLTAELLDALREEVARRASAPPALDPLDAADRRDAVAILLADLGMADPGEPAASLVALGWDGNEIDDLLAPFGHDEARLVVAAWLAAAALVRQLLAEVGLAAGQISEIVAAVREYTYLDRASLGRIDVTASIESTLVILRSRWKAGVEVRRAYAPDLPRDRGPRQRAQPGLDEPARERDRRPGRAGHGGRRGRGRRPAAAWWWRSATRDRGSPPRCADGSSTPSSRRRTSGPGQGWASTSRDRSWNATAAGWSWCPGIRAGPPSGSPCRPARRPRLPGAPATIDSGDADPQHRRVDGPERPLTVPAPGEPPPASERSRPAADARPPLPSGTVTFLFTDIEGSTRLVRELAERWPPLLDRHRAIIRAALAAHDGVEVQTEGDGFFAAFTRAPAAIAAAVRAQRDLAAEPWPPDAPIRVRMGLHAGEGVVDADGSYVGHDVHRAARVAGAAHGGQVLVSETVRALAGSVLPAGVAFRDLGQHRLKDLRPEPLAQLLVDGLPSDFPPVRSLDARPNNLPTQLTSFVGREHELATVAELLATTRLLTLTGPGGTGKTRLALQLAAAVADGYPDGVWFVALEPLRDPTLVLGTVARTIGVVQRPAETVLDALAAAICASAASCSCSTTSSRWSRPPARSAGSSGPARPSASSSRAGRSCGSPASRSTSSRGCPRRPTRAASRTSSWRTCRPALRHPSPASLGQYEAVRLFIARAVAVRPDFAVTNENAPAVAGICARLHGMPLAIELAAARVKLLGPEQILERLERQLGLLTSSARDLPDRQRTLRGAIAWSCDLLDEPRRQLLARLSVFRGGWSLEAAEAVAGATAAPVAEAAQALPGTAGGADSDVLDGLAALVDQSLVRSADDDDGPRFAMFETIREFAAEMLEAAGAAATIRDRHARVFLELAQRAAPHLQGADQRAWLDRLERDHDNLRAALARAAARPDPELAVALAFALWRFRQQRGYLVEARRELDALAARDWDLAPTTRARLAEALGGVAYWQADIAVAARWYDEALSIWRARAADGGTESRRELANALYNRGFVTVAAAMWLVGGAPGERPGARAMLDEALAIYEELDDSAGQGNVLWGRGGFELYGESPADAEPWFRRALELHRAAGHRTMEAWSLHMLSMTLIVQRRVAEARDAARHAIAHFRDASDLAGVNLALDALAAVAVGEGDAARAGRLWGAARHLQRTSGAELATWDEALLDTLPFSPRREIGSEDLERLAAEGAALPLTEAIAYALGEVDPFVGGEPGGGAGG